ncbi:hypothetical protein BgiBS90_030186, partial [Biomphalaria glabrata]
MFEQGRLVSIVLQPGVDLFKATDTYHSVSVSPTSFYLPHSLFLSYCAAHLTT